MLLSAHIESQCLTYAGFFMVLVLLSASVKKVGVSRMRDFLFYFYPCIVLSELNTSQGDLFCHTLTFSRNIVKFSRVRSLGTAVIYTHCIFIPGVRIVYHVSYLYYAKSSSS